MKSAFLPVATTAAILFMAVIGLAEISQPDSAPRNGAGAQPDQAGSQAAHNENRGNKS